MNNTPSATVRALLCASALTLIAPFSFSNAARAHVDDAAPRDVLYIESNNTTPGQNSVFAYHRNLDGSLTALTGSPFLTGGTGFATRAGLAGLDGENILAFDRARSVLFVPNGGSNSVSALHAAKDGSLRPINGSPFAIPGSTPEALALANRTLVVVNNNADAAQPVSSASYLTARLDERDALTPLPAAAIQLPPTSNPTEAVAYRNSSPFVYTNETAAGTLSTYLLDFSGKLHLVQTQSPPQEAGEAVQPAPLGQDLNPVAPYLYVGLPNVGRLAVYRTDGFATTFVRSTVSSGKAPCWVHVLPNGRTVYSANPGDHSISVYDISTPNSPVETQHLVLPNVAGALFDFAFSPDQRFMYLVEEESNAAAFGISNQVHILSINRTNGQLTETASSPVKLPIAGGQRVHGVLVR